MVCQAASQCRFAGDLKTSEPDNSPFNGCLLTHNCNHLLCFVFINLSVAQALALVSYTISCPFTDRLRNIIKRVIRIRSWQIPPSVRRAQIQWPRPPACNVYNQCSDSLRRGAGYKEHHFPEGVAIPRASSSAPGG